MLKKGNLDIHFPQDDKATLESLEQELCKARLELQQIKMACEKLRTKRERIQVLWVFYNCGKYSQVFIFIDISNMPILSDHHECASTTSIR